LSVLHSEKVDYLQGKEKPLDCYHEFNDEFIASISPETLFVVQIFAMKYKMEIPVLNIKNTIPEDGKPYTKHESTLYVYKPDDDPEVIHQDLYDPDELSKRFEYILVVYNSLKLNDKETAIDTNKFCSIHVKMIKFKKKLSLEEMIGKPKEEQIDWDRLEKVGRKLMNAALNKKKGNDDTATKAKSLDLDRSKKKARELSEQYERDNKRKEENNTEEDEKDGKAIDNVDNNVDTTHTLVTQSQTSSPEKIKKNKKSVTFSEGTNPKIDGDPQQEKPKEQNKKTLTSLKQTPIEKMHPADQLKFMQNEKEKIEKARIESEKQKELDESAKKANAHHPQKSVGKIPPINNDSDIDNNDDSSTSTLKKSNLKNRSSTNQTSLDNTKDSDQLEAIDEKQQASKLPSKKDQKKKNGQNLQNKKQINLIFKNLSLKFHLVIRMMILILMMQAT